MVHPGDSYGAAERIPKLILLQRRDRVWDDIEPVARVDGSIAYELEHAAMKCVGPCAGAQIHLIRAESVLG